MKKFTVLLIVMLNIASCSIRYGPLREYSTSFESISDFNGFYIVPQDYMNTSSHVLTNNIVHSGSYSHIGWIYGANPEGGALDNKNHRGYPTIQLHKTSGGSFITPCLITLWVWLDMPLAAHSPENQWFSFVTLTPDSSDTWNRTVLVNLSYEGSVMLMHVPYQGQKQFFYQNNELKFPQRQWVKLTIYIDFDPDAGYAKVWQDDVLVSYAPVRGCRAVLSQAHFGLYAAPSITNGEIYNDDLDIREVEKEP